MEDEWVKGIFVYSEYSDMLHFSTMSSSVGEGAPSRNIGAKNSIQKVSVALVW